MRRWLTVAALGLGLAWASPGHAGVNVNIGIDLPGPPALAPVPGTPVMYAPAVAGNYFFYGGRYFAFVGGAWYAGPGYDGPWAIVAPELVPRPILAVPVQYYRGAAARMARVATRSAAALGSAVGTALGRAAAATGAAAREAPRGAPIAP